MSALQPVSVTNSMGLGEAMSIRPSWQATRDTSEAPHLLIRCSCRRRSRPGRCTRCPPGTLRGGGP